MYLYQRHFKILNVHVCFFSYRLKQELERLVTDKCRQYSPLGALKFKFHQPPAHASTTAWVGGTYYNMYTHVVNVVYRVKAFSC